MSTEPAERLLFGLRYGHAVETETLADVGRLSKQGMHTANGSSSARADCADASDCYGAKLALWVVDPASRVSIGLQRMASYVLAMVLPHSKGIESPATPESLRMDEASAVGPLTSLIGKGLGTAEVQTMLDDLRAQGWLRSSNRDRGPRIDFSSEFGLALTAKHGTISTVWFELHSQEDRRGYPGPLPWGIETSLTLREAVSRFGQPRQGGGVQAVWLRYPYGADTYVEFAFKKDGSLFRVIVGAVDSLLGSARTLWQAESEV